MPDRLRADPRGIGGLPYLLLSLRRVLAAVLVSLGRLNPGITRAVGADNFVRMKPSGH